MKYELNNIGDDTYLIFSRGHHPLEDFTKYVKEEYDDWGDFFEIAYHHYYRKIGNQYGTWYEPCFPFIRGAFKVTVAQEGWSKSCTLQKRIEKGDHIYSQGNWYILKHYWLKDVYELWYSANNFVPTEIRSFKSISEAKQFVEKLIQEGKY